MEATIKILDVTSLEPRMKHPTIFAWFDGLEAGEEFMIHNDHDPKPLYYQLLGERGKNFTWQYVEQGPESWKVIIGKFPEGTSEATVGEIAAKDLRKVEVFKKYGLDFCCGGKKTLREACLEKGIDVTRIEKELQDTDKTNSFAELNFADWEPAFLAEYIVNVHHAYVRKVMPELVHYAKKVSNRHAEKHPELNEIAKLVLLLEKELPEHFSQEEEVVFPAIKAIFAGEPLSNSDIGNVIDLMEDDHEEVGKILASLNKLTNGYTVPEDACASYTLLFNALNSLESDMFTHIHIENNILFPKAIERLQQY